MDSDKCASKQSMIAFCHSQRNGDHSKDNHDWKRVRMGSLRLILMQKAELHPVVARVAIVRDLTHNKILQSIVIATVG
jgi:hypothetical protein